MSDLEVELIKSSQTLAKRWRRDIDSAGEEVFICLPAAVFDRFSESLADALDRGVAVGGANAVIEDYEALDVRLERAE